MSGKDAGELSLGAQLLLEMREDIIGGRLLPGTALVEGELVKAYNASRSGVRLMPSSSHSAGSSIHSPGGSR